MQPPARAPGTVAPVAGLMPGLRSPFGNANAFAIGGHVMKSGWMKSSMLKKVLVNALSIPWTASWQVAASGTGDVRFASSCFRQSNLTPF